ncbi:uncharacterized protein LOC108664695 [Hyalella azteca]|uniref:Uncharacterized protein LOC108664695 n=1 Tax=Hyalella azteca TaxID=294128 RepID=A0A8B7N0V8_HYAAZ|nr:uncharacterized protein LOC108664695 [Hyalella azteca]XP_018006849.1 uncharacterized protein LOC108664695 [Hyalella azteca]XP_047737300.1 uncharacterized protein LOC108664695 [Hyalella azteca]
MVKSFESEQPNLSFVHINQAMSAGSNGYMRGYITNGIQRTDEMVVNAELLHKSLTAPAQPDPIVASPYWDLDVTESNIKEAKNLASKPPSNPSVPNQSLGAQTRNGLAVGSVNPIEAGRVAVDTRAVVAVAGDPVTSAAAHVDISTPQTSMVAPTSDCAPSTSPITIRILSVGGAASNTGASANATWNRVAGAAAPIRVVVQPTESKAPQNTDVGSRVTGYPKSDLQTATRYRVAVSGDLAGASVASATQKNSSSMATASSSASDCAPKTSSMPGLKRPSTDVAAFAMTKLARTIGPKPVSETNSAALLEENNRLAAENEALRKKNEEFQEKLNLLSIILRDPRKRELLDARLRQHCSLKFK